jgi:hypothetical protein
MDDAERIDEIEIVRGERRGELFAANVQERSRQPENSEPRLCQGHALPGEFDAVIDRSGAGEIDRVGSNSTRRTNARIRRTPVCAVR